MTRTLSHALLAFATVLLLAPLAKLHAAAPALHTFSTIQADSIGQKLQSAMIETVRVRQGSRMER